VFDLELMDVDEGFRAFRVANAGLIGGIEAVKMSQAAALDAMRRLLNPPQTQQALATIRSRPRLQTAAALENFADAAFATGHPLFAICGLWLIEERWPGNPDVRFNLASLLALHGAVNEAQALLDDLVARQTLPVHPFGITAQQGGNYLRAYILTRQGRTAEAARLLKPIVAANPSFGEAALLFALVAESEEEARQAYAIGIWRRRPPARPPAQVSADAGGEADTQGTEDKKHPPKRSRSKRTGLDVALLVDLSKGKPGELPAIPQPVSLAERKEFGKWAGEAMQFVSAESRALLEARDAPMERCRQKNLPQPVRDRLMALESIIEPENSNLPELRSLFNALNQAIDDKTNALERVGDRFYQRAGEINARMDLDGDQKCALLTPLAEAADATMRAHVQAVDLATRRLHRRWHQNATVHIKASSQVTYGMLISNMTQSCAFAMWGCEPAKPKQKNELGKTESGGLAKCSEEEAKNSVGVEASGDLGSHAKPLDVSVGIEVTCDGFSLEVGTELFKSVGLSAEAEFKIDGTCTLYLGPKATMGVGPEFGGKEASIKGGVYLTMDKDSFTDAGVKSVVKTTTKIEALGVSGTVSHTEGNEGDQKHSFFPGPNSGHNASGLAEFR
jgi:tetratricopeptide (TPR) repeat protein